MVDAGQSIIENAHPIRWDFVSSWRCLPTALDVSTFRLPTQNQNTVFGKVPF